MDLSNDDLLRIAADAALAEDDIPRREPAPVLTKILAADTGTGPLRRHAGWSQPEQSGLSPLNAFIDTAAELGALVDSLEPNEWTQRTRVEGASIRALVEHLVGMERYVLGQLDRGPVYSADRREDHWPVTRLAAADASQLSDRDLASRWWQEVLQLVAACSELGPEHPVRYHHLAGSVRGLMVSRTFELWTHGDDIRQAVGAPLSLLDDARLSLMVSELMGALPLGMALTGNDAPGRAARFVLDGPGGGTYDVALTFGERPTEPDLVVSTSAIDLCRLAANRLGPGELDAVVVGDRSLLEPVLAAAAAFAAD